MTYRRGFAEIEKSGIKSDAGWGCMIRCGQMMLMQGLVEILFGSEFCKPERNGGGSERSKLYDELLSLFFDDPEAPFSIHAIAALGNVKFGKEIGHWFGVSTISVVLAELVNKHRPLGMRSVVFDGGAIYKDKVVAVATEQPITKDPRVTEIDDDWAPVMLWAVVALGLDAVNPAHINSIMMYFRIPDSIGFIGGKFQHAFYFVASQGEMFYYLDPHSVFPALSQHELEQSGYESVTSPSLHSMKLSEAVPQIALGFLCRNRAAFERVCEFIAFIETTEPHAALIVRDTTPQVNEADYDPENTSFTEDGFEIT